MKFTVLLAAPALTLVFLPAYASPVVKPIAQGVTLTQQVLSSPPEILNILTVDLSQPGVRIECSPTRNTLTGPTGDITQGREDVKTAAESRGAVAAVNGDFFPFTGDPLGAGIWNGEIYSEPYEGRSVMGVSVDGRSVTFSTLGFLGELQTVGNRLTTISGVNRLVSSQDTSDLVVCTPRFGPRSGIRPGCTEMVMTGVNLPLRPSKLLLGTIAAINTNVTIGSPIPADGVVLVALGGGPAATFLQTACHVGSRAEFVCAMAPQADLPDALRVALQPRDSSDMPARTTQAANPAAYQWATMEQAIGGGPYLVVNGQVSVDASGEGFNDSFINDPNPRTGVGVTADDKLLLVTVDGRQSISPGISLNAFAQIMLNLGCVNAMNLDGGGSTTMVAGGVTINSPSGAGSERPVADMVAIYANPLQAYAPAANAPKLAVLTPAQPVPVGSATQLNATLGRQKVAGDSSAFLWSGAVTNGIGFVAQDGRFFAQKAGTGLVTISYDGQKDQEPITVGTASAEPASPQPEVYTLSARLLPVSQDNNQVTPISVRIVSSSGMPLAHTKIHLDVDFGTPDNADLTTDADGAAQSNITWDGTSGSVKVSAANLKAVNLVWSGQ